MSMATQKKKAFVSNLSGVNIEKLPRPLARLMREGSSGVVANHFYHSDQPSYDHTRSK